MTARDWLTVTEVAAELRVSRMSVYRLIDERQITHLRVGKQIRIPAEALEGYLQRHTRRAVLRPVRNTA